MTREEIIKLAREAGFEQLGPDIEDWVCFTEEIERFAALVAAAERQRLHEKFMEIHKSQQHSNNYWHFAARKIKEEA